MSVAITIHGPAFSSYVRAVFLCCNRKRVDFQLQTAGSKIAQLNPFQRVPVVEHDGMTLFETAAICRYIDRAFDGPLLSPSVATQLAWMDQWISAANCYFDSAIIRRYVLEYAFPKGEGGEVRRDVVAEAETEVKRYLAIMEQALNQYDYFSGEAPGIADYMIVPMLDYLANGITTTNLVADWPLVEAYLEGMRQRTECKGVLGNPRML